MNAVSGPISNRKDIPEISSGTIPDRGKYDAQADENRVIGANVDFYRQIAGKYDRYETYVFDPLLQLFSIMLAKLPFWAQIKNLRTRRHEACKFVKSRWIDMIFSNSERYNVGLQEYVKIMRNIYSFQSKEFWAQVPHFSCSISLSILVI